MSALSMVCATVAFLAAVAPDVPPEGSATAGRALFTEAFDSSSTRWTSASHEGRIEVRFGAKVRNYAALVVTGVHSAQVDTAWSVRSPRIVLPERRDKYFAVSFDIATDTNLSSTAEQLVQWQNVVFWFDCDGAKYAKTHLSFAAASGDFRTVRMSGEIPPDAAACEIQLGFDGPNLPLGKSVAYRDLSFLITKTLAAAQKRRDRGDFSPPRVKMTSQSPTSDRGMRPAFSVTDETGVDWTRLKMVLDGRDVTGLFERTGNSFVWRGETGWTDGIHKLDVFVADTLGHSYTAKKRFFIGQAPKCQKVTLRDDGMTLVDGRPFFPIGIYGVMRREFNGFNFDTALGALKKGGFNTAHSYWEARDPEFISNALGHGFQIWMETRLPDTRFANVERHYPHVLAWYLGDDTSVHEKPWELRDYEEATKAVDPNRITCQADGVRAAAEYSAYCDYVDGTDVFMPEIYPMHLGTPEDDMECVARVIRDMKRVAADNAAVHDGRPHGVWPIIQYFKGWGWKRFPTREELFGMTFAAICHGANGMMWYAYNGTVRPEKNQYNYGVTSTPERWQNICDLATRLKLLSPVLIERTPSQPPQPEIIAGPKRDPLCFDSISFLLKRHEGAVWLIAVNSSDRCVTARFDLLATCQGSATAEVLFEDRRVMVQNGMLVDAFSPFEAHVYKLEVEQKK